MKILPNISFLDLAVIYKDNLIIGDIQLGYEEAMEVRGVLLPRFQLKDTLERLERIFTHPTVKKANVKRVIINGDIKHEFGTVTSQEWRDSLRLFDWLVTKVQEIVLIKGNHDLALAPLAAKRNLKVVDAWEDENVTVLHGHKIPLSLNNIIIIGHEHPCISFKEKPHEKFKCFLVGTYQKKRLIVMPSFTTLTTGSDVLSTPPFSPFLKDGVRSFECYAVDDQGEPRYFGKVGDIEHL